MDGAYWTMSVELRFYVLATWLSLSVIYPLVQGHIIVKVIDLFLMFEWSPAFIAGVLMADSYKSKKINIKNGTAIFICFILSTLHRMIYAKMAMIIYQETFSKPIIAAVIFSVYAILLLVVLGRLKWLNKSYFLYLAIITYPLYFEHQRIGYIIFNNLMGNHNKYLILSGTITLMITASFIIVKYIAGPLSNYLEKYLGLIIDFFLNLRYNSASLDTKKIEKMSNSISDK